MKRIILCADDYGQNEAISQAILDLLAKNRLTAVSCLSTTKHWFLHAEWLKTYENQADIGLHFNLTYQKPYSLRGLLLRCYLHTLSRETIAFELNAQLDRFIEGWGRPPDFIDGHQHIHQFPLIRDVLLDVYEKRGLTCYVRCTYSDNILSSLKINAFLKRVFIQFGIAKSFKMQLLQRKIPHHSSFSGIYNFSITDYGNLFRLFLNQVNDMGLIMCHPGFQNTLIEKDEIQEARFQEWTYFSSDTFQKECDTQNILLTRFFEQ